jgi:fatty acid desaturase
MNHPHDLQSAPIPVRLPADELKALSRLEPRRTLAAIAAEWATIAGAIAVASLAGHILVHLAAVVLIGARQHALLVIAHDASHLRLLPVRRWNDWLANILLAWPMFISVQGFRYFHGPHHRLLGAAGDGNRMLWATHDAHGELRPEWRYPKPPAAIALKILRRAALVTGLWWIVRGLVGGFQFGASSVDKIARGAFVAGVAAVLVATGAGWGFLWFWVLPYCTWHVAAQYIRLACEHSNLQGSGGYEMTRTTVPRWWERLLIPGTSATTSSTTGIRRCRSTGCPSCTPG